MSVSLTGRTVALMVASGFYQHQFSALQRALIKAGATLKTISTDIGLVNGWDSVPTEANPQGTWGHSYPVDAQLGNVLAADLDALVIPGGDRSIAKLKTNLNTARIVRHMLDAGMPVVFCDTGMQLLDGLNRPAGETATLQCETTAENWVDAVITHINTQLNSPELQAAA